eukprot:1136239-Pelagomonas_calceolata.AAC.2
MTSCMVRRQFCIHTLSCWGCEHDWASQCVWAFACQPEGRSQPSLPLYAHEFAQRQYKIQVWWSKCAYTRRQRDVFLGRLYSKYPDEHAMLRRSNRTQTTPVAHSVWDKY